MLRRSRHPLSIRHALLAELLLDILAQWLIVMLLLHPAQSLGRELLTVHALQDVLLARAVVADGNDDAGGDVTAQAETENGRCKCFRPDLVVDRPSARSESNLEDAVEVQKYYDSNEQSEGESMVR